MRALASPRVLKLSASLSETCLVVASKKASRRDVIQFVANKLGGVHFDTKRAAGDEAYDALDRARLSIRPADLDAAYHELCSIDQQFAASEDVVGLIQ
jgi:hypothetical protein